MARKKQGDTCGDPCKAPPRGRDPYKTSVGGKESIEGCVILGTAVAQLEDAQSHRKRRAHDGVSHLGV